MEAILAYLRKTYAPHTVIVYGSYADGTQQPDSDFDAVIITDKDCPAHDAAVIDGVQLDVWPIKSEAVSGDIDGTEYAHLLGGRILLDERGDAARLLNAASEAEAALPWPDREEIKGSLAWCGKMLRPTQRGDAEGMYRTHWLLTDSLSIWCDVIRERYRGPKKALKMLLHRDPAGYLLYREALADCAEAQLDAWIAHLHRLFDDARRVSFRVASRRDMERIGQLNVDLHPGDTRWAAWRDASLARYGDGASVTFVCAVDDMPVGEVTLLLSPACDAIQGRTLLADGRQTGNVNGLRVAKAFEGRGFASGLLDALTQYATAHGLKRLTIGVEAKETRNRAIYQHWGFTEHLLTEEEDGETVLYYAKEL